MMKFKKIYVSIILMVSTQIPRFIHWELWLPNSGTPQYFYLARYILECLFWFILFIYLSWCILTSSK